MAMLLLTTTSEKIQLASSSTANLSVHASWLENNAGVVTPGTQDTLISSIATTDIVAVPSGASIQKNIRRLNIRNTHASTANTVTLQKIAAAGTIELIKIVLAAQETLTLDTDGWQYYDSLGQLKVSAQVPAASATVAGIAMLASQADMEAATDANKIVTAVNVKFNPGVNKHWLMATVSGAVPTMQVNWNVTSITDTATGTLGITFATAFSSANYAAQCAVEMTATTYAVANDRKVKIRSGTRAAGSISLDCLDSTVTTHLLADPSSWHYSDNGDFV